MGRWLARAPRYVYKARLGRLLGRRFVLLEHTGRRSGLPRETVLEVVRHDDASLDVAAAWGRGSDWFRNLEADSAVHVSTGPRRRVAGTAAVQSSDEATAVFAGYARAHPRAARALAAALGLPLGDPTAMAASVPLVRITFDAG